jgi:hypothetical protein
MTSLDDVLVHIAYDAQISSSEAFTMLCDIVYGKAHYLINALHPAFMLHLGPYVLVDQYRVKQVGFSGLAMAVQLEHRAMDVSPGRVIVNPYMNPLVRQESIRESIIDAEHWHRHVRPTHSAFS